MFLLFCFIFFGRIFSGRRNSWYSYRRDPKFLPGAGHWPHLVVASRAGDLKNPKKKVVFLDAFWKGNGNPLWWKWWNIRKDWSDLWFNFALFLKLCSFTWMVLERNVIFWLVKRLNNKHLRDIRHSVHDAAVNIIYLLYHLYILPWFPSNLNLDHDIINQSSPSSAAAGWKVCLWAFASVYRLDQSPKNSEAESKKNTVSFRILPWYALIFDRHLLKFTVYHQFCMRSRWWFQIFFLFNPTWGNDPIWLIFFRLVETTN